MTTRRTLFALVLILAVQVLASAQQPATNAMINFGGLRVQACSVSADAGYGLTAAKPLQIGGGPSLADSRLNRFLSALRGPNGETLRIAPGRGSMLAPIGYMDTPVILDNYQILVGDQKMSLFVDDYHYGIPKAPMGLTCAGPLVTVLGAPPLDPLLLNKTLTSLAIEEGSTQDFPAVPLDVSTPRGYLYNVFSIVAQRARMAANNGMPMDPKKPPTFSIPGLLALAIPVPCGAKTLTPQRIELSGPQGPIQQIGQVLKDDALAAMLPGTKLPAGSIAMGFRPSQVSGIKIAYSEGCDATPAEVPLLVRVDAPRPPLRPLPMPAGVNEAEPGVYLQVILDPLGQFSSVEYIGGPKSLVPAAIDYVRKLRAEPVRLNGVAIENAVILPILFQ